MAGIKIVNLPAAPSAQLTDVFPVSQGGVTYKESNSQLLTLFQSVPGGAGGSNTQIQYNSSGILAGDTGFTTNGAGTLLLNGQLTVDNITINGNTISSSSSNTIFMGSSTNVFTPLDDLLQLANNNSNNLLGICSFQNVNYGPVITFLNSRNTTVGGHTTIQNGDELGTLIWEADDGTNYISVAGITVLADGTVSAGVIPTEMDFSITDSTGAFFTALRLLPSKSSLFPGTVSGVNFIPGYTTTATAGSTTTLNVNSTYLQYFTGTLNQTVVMPVTSTLTFGQAWKIVNNSSGSLTVNSSGGNLILTMAANTIAEITCILTSGTTAASWNSTYIFDAGGSGIVSPGTINQLAWYSATGSTVSGLTGANSAVLVTTAAGVPGLTGSLTDGQLVIGSTAGTPTPATLTAGTGVSITNSSGSITINAGGGGMSWTTLAGTSQAAAVNNGYISGAAGATTITLPVTAAIGSMVAVEGLGAGGWILTANTGQTIKIGSSTTTSAGSLTSVAASDNVYVTCIVANTTWRVRSTNSAGLTIS